MRAGELFADRFEIEALGGEGGLGVVYRARDRETGKEWLEAHGDSNALALATHFELAGDPRRAIPYWHRAAEQALSANDLAAAIERAERGITAGAHGTQLGELSVVLGEAARWSGDLERADSALREARALLGPGSRAWCVAAREHAVVLQRTSRSAEADQLCEQLLEVRATPDERAPVELALARIRAAMAVSYLGSSESARRLMDAVERDLPPNVLRAPIVSAWIHRQRADEAGRRGEIAAFLAHTERSITDFRSAGLERAAVSETVTIGYALLELGAYERALSVLAEAETSAARLGLAQPAAVARQNVALAFLRLGRIGEARSSASSAIASFCALGEHRMEGATRLYLALVHADAGELELAETEARRAVDQLREAAPPLLPEALATLAHVLLRANRGADALEPASHAHRLLETSGAESGEALIRASFAEAAWQTGAREQALAVIERARSRLEQRAAAIGDAELRRSFFERVPENARTLELWQTWRSAV